MPLVRVCAAGMGSVWSWRTWRAAQASYFRLDMLKTGRFLVKLGKYDSRNVAKSECCRDLGPLADRGGGAREPRRPPASRWLHLLLPLTALLYGLLVFTAGDRGRTAGPCETGRAAGYRHT